MIPIGSGPEETNASDADCREGGNQSALIVDDDTTIRETLREFFIGRGFAVTVARDAPRACELLRAKTGFDMVLTDLRLPSGDGVEILRVAREEHPESCVVLMTGFATLESAVEAVRLGAYEYLVKPFSLGELDLILNRIAGHRDLASDHRRLRGEVERLRPLEALIKQQEEMKQSVDELIREVREQRELLVSLGDCRKNDATVEPLTECEPPAAQNSG